MKIKLGNIKHIETELGEVLLVSWYIGNEAYWCITLRQLCKLMNLHYRPNQMLNRIEEDSFIEISSSGFETKSIWDYEELFEGNSEFLLNKNGLEDFVSGSKRKDAKNALKTLIRIIEILDSRLY